MERGAKGERREVERARVGAREEITLEAFAESREPEGERQHLASHNIQH